MATTYYLDYVGGGDNSHDAKSFANRVKNWVKITPAAGDEVRIMASPDPTSLGSVSWTSASANITLASAVTLAVGDHSNAWTASTNVTAAANSIGSQLISGYQTDLTIASGFTTGLVGYLAISSLNLSAYQQLSLFYKTDANVSGLELRLCTDTAGATAVHTVPLPAAANNEWHPVVVDFGTGLNAAIQSIAVYATTTPGAVKVSLNNLVACKASSSSDSLTHNSLVAKINALPWAPSTAYSLNDIRKPLVVSRNGWGYKCTTAGTSGSSEPTWPDRKGATVTDGTAIWTCNDLEEMWYSIVNFNGTTVLLEETQYVGATETIASYKREPIVMDPAFNAGGGGCLYDGTSRNYIKLSGGWDTTTMSAQTGETWIAGRNMQLWPLRRVNAITPTAYQGLKYWNISHLHFRRHVYGINAQKCDFTLTNMSVGSSLIALDEWNTASSVASSAVITMKAVKFQGNHRILRYEGADINMDKCDLVNGRLPDPSLTTDYAEVDAYPVNPEIGNVEASNYTTYVSRTRMRGAGFRLRGGQGHFFPECDLDPANYNNIAASSDCTLLRCANCFDGSNNQLFGARERGWMKVQECTTGHPSVSFIDARATAMIQTDTSTVHTGGGQSWKFIASDTWGSLYQVDPSDPIKLPVGRIYVASGTTKTISIWARTDSTYLHGRLVARAAQLDQVPEQVVDITPGSTNTWTQSGALTITPNTSGVIELEVWFDCDIDPGSVIGNFWVDDLTVV